MSGYTIKQSGSVPVTTYVPAYAWRCEHCGWLGTELHSYESAVGEAERHTRERHDQEGEL